MEEARRQLKEWDEELNKLHSQNGDLDLQVQSLQSEQKRLQGCLQEKQAELDEVRSQLSTQTAPQESKILDLPDAATLLNQLKSRRKKSKADLGDVEEILELLPPAPEKAPQLPDLYAAKDKLFEMGGWKFEKGEKRERFYAFAEALIEEASKLNPDYTIIQRLQSDLKQVRGWDEAGSTIRAEQQVRIETLERKLGLRK